MFSRSNGVGRRLAHFLAAFTAPQWVTQTVDLQSPDDSLRAAKVLDLVLEILLNANLGLELIRQPGSQPDRWTTTRRVHAPDTGARFEIQIGQRGGYDLRVISGKAAYVGRAMSFEALTMALRTFASVTQTSTRAGMSAEVDE